jgi:hypothetical protein
MQKVLFRVCQKRVQFSVDGSLQAIELGGKSLGGQNEFV